MNSIEKYFTGEKWQCTIGALIALLCIGLSIYYISLQKPFFKGIACVFVPLSTLLLIICVGIIIRTPKDSKRVNDYSASQPAKLKTEELPRMEKVMKSFSVVKKVEICFFVIGFLLFLVFGKSELIKGIAVGLIIQGLLLYSFDFIAEYRAKPYVEFLKKI
jgi:hypothetical protein